MTKKILLPAITCAILMTISAFAQTDAQRSDTQRSDAQRSFDQMKSLAGSWEGKNPKGVPVNVSYQLTAGGSALMSEISLPRDGRKGQGRQSDAAQEDMITMIHLDGPERLLMTHYCSIGNQPRMQATPSPDGKTITFKFIDATNLATPGAGHMDHVTIAMLDPNHHTEEWIFNDHGKELKETFDLWRKQ